MKKILLLIVIIFFIFISILIFLPEVSKAIDGWLLTEDEILSWKEKATDGNMTATSNLIIFSKSKIEKDKWFELYMQQRKQRKEEYYLKKKSK